MKIRQDPITKLWCREDGAVLMPPSRRGGMHFRWTYGYKTPTGYKAVRFCGKHHLVHRIICRAFNGLAPKDKLFVDHIDRIRDDNRSSNLRWVSIKENNDNADRVDQAFEKYKVRCCEDRAAYGKAYNKAWYEAHREERKACAKAYYEERSTYLKARVTARYAKKKAQGLHYCKGPDSKYGWFPRSFYSENHNPL